MKKKRFINLLILTLLCQGLFSQNDNLVKFFYWQKTDSFEESYDSTNIALALKKHINTPKDYEFIRQVIKGSKGEMSEKDNLGYVHERYSQYYKGIKIENSDIRVRYLNGLFDSSNGQYINANYIDTSVFLSKEMSIQKAIDFIRAKKYFWEDERENIFLQKVLNDKLATYYPNPELVISKNDLDLSDTLFYMAYKIDIYAKEPISRDYIFVNAKNGEILAVNPILVNANGTAATRYSGSQTIITSPYNFGYRLASYDIFRSVDTKDLKKGTNYFTASDFEDLDNNWTSGEFNNVNKDNGALDAHWGAVATLDYFKNVHYRSSYDGYGAIVWNYVHYSTNYDNAFWDGSRIVYGDGFSYDILTSLDIVAHEFGHGVTQSTANLVYSNESGAINESLSDIWSACVKNYANNYFPITTKPIWLIGNEINGNNAVRNMSYPTSTNQPDTYGGGLYWTGPTAGVHTNSGIMNHWFYILSMGKSGTNGLGFAYYVTGIGLSKAEKIVYKALTAHMTSGTNFYNARKATIQAATTLYGSYSTEVLAVINSWNAVGVIDISGPLSICLSSSASYSVPYLPTGYSWGSNNMTISGSGASITAIGNSLGSGYLIIKNSSGVEVARINITISNCKGGNTNNAMVFPNPVDDILNVDLSHFINTTTKIANNFDLRLYDSHGNMLQQKTAKIGIVQFNVATLSDGMYFLHVHNGASPTPDVHKVFIKH